MTDALKEFFSEYNFLRQINKVESLKYIFKILVKFHIKESNVKFSDEEIKQLINCAVLKQLTLSIENANNTKQTVYSFCKSIIKIDGGEVSQKYSLRNEQIRKNKSSAIIDVDNDKILHILNNLEKLSDNLILRREQTQNEEIVLDRDFKYEKYNGTDKKRTIKKKYLYDCISLCAADNLDKAFKLYNLLLLYTKPLEISSKKISPKGSLEEGYKELSLFLNLFEELSNKELVINTLCFYKFEYSFRFCFAFKLAKYMIDNQYEDLQGLPVALLPFFQRVELENMDKRKIALSPFIKDYDRVIGATFDVYQNREKSEKIFNKIKNAVVIIEKSYLLYNNLISSNCKSLDAICEDWCEQDFDDIAAFLKTDIDIFGIIKSYELNNIFNLNHQKKNSILMKTKELYTQGIILDSGFLQYTRDNLKNKRKKRNLRPNKMKN